MALQNSGPISASDINNELGNSSTSLISLNDTDVRNMAGIVSGPISFQDLYGASAAYQVAFTSGFDDTAFLDTAGVSTTAPIIGTWDQNGVYDLDGVSITLSRFVGIQTIANPVFEIIPTTAIPVGKIPSLIVSINGDTFTALSSNLVAGQNPNKWVGIAGAGMTATQLTNTFNYLKTQGQSSSTVLATISSSGYVPAKMDVVITAGTSGTKTGFEQGVMGSVSNNQISFNGLTYLLEAVYHDSSTGYQYIKIDSNGNPDMIAEDCNNFRISNVNLSGISNTISFNTTSGVSTWELNGGDSYQTGSEEFFQLDNYRLKNTNSFAITDATISSGVFGFIDNIGGVTAGSPLTRSLSDGTTFHSLRGMTWDTNTGDLRIYIEGNHNINTFNRFRLGYGTGDLGVTTNFSEASDVSLVESNTVTRFTFANQGFDHSTDLNAYFEPVVIPDYTTV